MKNEIPPDDETHKELVELHKHISELEKLEVERKRTEKELKEIEEKIHNLFNDKAEGIIIVQDRLIKYANPCAAELLGYNPVEVTGTSFAHYVHPDELPKLAKYYLKRIAGEDAPPVYETIVKHKNGSDVSIRIKASVINYQGRLADFIAIKKL